MLRSAPEHGLGLELGPLSLRPVLETHEDEALALPAAGEVIAAHLENRIDRRGLLVDQVLGHVRERLVGARLRRAERRLHQDVGAPLVVVWQKRRWDLE